MLNGFYENFTEDKKDYFGQNEPVLLDNRSENKSSFRDEIKGKGIEIE
ncbi:hypothetical protein [Pleomorphovibrio marinus]|nr:hypothetical protein [Pleomorphovibrio marinus]